MEFDLSQSIALLVRTPAALNTLLSGLPDAWTTHNEGEGTWTVTEVIAHLIECEHTNWMPRAKSILRSTEPQPFASFDREGYKQDNQVRSLPQRLDEFARIRATSLDELRALNLQPTDFNRRGVHSVFGPVTLSQLLSTWTVHDMTHLHQISRILAHQYREAVGPWSQYLGVLHCNGHSA